MTTFIKSTLLYILLPILFYNNLDAMDLSKEHNQKKRTQDEIQRADQEKLPKNLKQNENNSEEDSLPVKIKHAQENDSDSEEDEPRIKKENVEEDELVLMAGEKENDVSKKRTRDEQQREEPHAAQVEPQVKKAQVLTKEEAFIGRLFKKDDSQQLKKLLDNGKILLHTKNLLHYAAGLDAAKCTELLLSSGLSPSTVDNAGRTALHVAAKGNAIECIRVLCNHMFATRKIGEINALSLAGQTPLDMATDIVCKKVLEGQLALHSSELTPSKKASEAMTFVKTLNLTKEKGIQLFREWNIDIQETDETGYTLLHHACIGGDELLVKILLELGAHTTVGISRGLTALHLASLNNSLTCLKALLDQTADLNEINALSEEGTALDLAKNALCKNLLKEKGALRFEELDVVFCTNQLKGTHGSFFTEMTTIQKIRFALKLGEDTCISLLRAMNVDVNAADKNGDTPLHIASRESELKVLLALGADPDALNKNNDTPLHKASNAGDYASVALLLSYKANKDARNKKGNTPLHLACSKGREECIRVLLENDANPNILNNKDETPLHIACKFGKLECVKLLLVHGADREVLDKNGYPPIFYAIQKKKHLIVQLMRSCDSVKAQNCIETHRTLTPLQFAIAENNLAQVKVLLKKSTKALCTNEFLLHHAAQKGNPACLKLVLAKKVPVNGCDGNGRTALHCAAEEGYKACVELLLDSEALIDVQDLEGATALHYAAKSGAVECVELLLARNANRTEVNKAHKTALDEANSAGNFACAKLLMTEQEITLPKQYLPFTIKLSHGELVTIPLALEGYAQLLTSMRSLLTEDQEPIIEIPDCILISKESLEHIIALGPELEFLETSYLKLAHDSDGSAQNVFEQEAKKMAQSHSSQDIQSILIAANYLQIDCLRHLAQISWGKAIVRETIAKINEYPAELAALMLKSFIGATKEFDHK